MTVTTPTTPGRHTGHTTYSIRVDFPTESVLRPWSAAQRMPFEEAIVAILRGAATGLRAQQGGAKPTPPSPAPSPTPAPSPPTVPALAAGPASLDPEVGRELSLLRTRVTTLSTDLDRAEENLKRQAEVIANHEARRADLRRELAEARKATESAVSALELAALHAPPPTRAPEFEVTDAGVLARLYLPDDVVEAIASRLSPQPPSYDRVLVVEPPAGTDFPTATIVAPSAQALADVVRPKADRDARMIASTEERRSAASRAPLPPAVARFLEHEEYWAAPIEPRRAAVALLPFITDAVRTSPRNEWKPQRDLLTRLTSAYREPLNQRTRAGLLHLVPDLRRQITTPDAMLLKWPDLRHAIGKLAGWDDVALVNDPEPMPNALAPADPDPVEETALAEAPAVEAPVPGSVPAAAVLGRPAPALAPFVNPKPGTRPYVRLAPLKDRVRELVLAGYSDVEISSHLGCSQPGLTGFRKNTLGLAGNRSVPDRPAP